MVKKTLITFFLLLLFCYGFSQITFMKRYGSGQPFDIRQTTDGGYIIVGNKDYIGYAIKTDSLGDTLWTKTYDFISNIRTVEQTQDGGYLMAGRYLIKTGANGDTLWIKWLGGGNIIKMDKTFDGGYVLAGVEIISGNYDVLFIKIDSAYNEIWRKTFGGALDETANSVQQTLDGGYIIGCNKQNGFVYIDTFGSPYRWFDSWLIKTDSAGNEVWSRIYDTPDSASSIEAVRQINDGGYILAVSAQGIWGDPYPMYLIKTDANGDTLWTKRYADGEPKSVAQTADGGYMIGGYSTGYGAQGFDKLLIKSDANGNILWTGTYGSPNNDMGAAAILTNDGGYAITGEWWYGTGSDILLVKTDSLGNAPPLTVINELAVQKEPLINIYPNPANYNLTLEFETSEKSNALFSIYDYTGKEIKRISTKQLPKGKHQEQINTQKLAPGIYLLVSNINGQLRTMRFVKM